MTKISNASAYFSRLQQLAEVNKSGVKKTNNFGLGTLIDSKRTLDGVAYGIVKENHHYYIKKGGLKENLDVSDFTYIGGIANITEYQYNSLAEADKKRNMMLNVLNESTKVKSNLSKTKLNENEVKEDVVDDKFNSMNKSVNKLDVATATEKQKASTPPQANVPDLSDEQPIPDADEPNLELDDEKSDTDKLDTSAEPTPETGTTPTEPISEDDYNEAKSELGKAVALFGEKQLSKEQVETILNTIVTPLKKNLIPLEVEERKELAAPILGVEDVNAEEDLQNTMGDETGLEENDTTGIENSINKINDLKKSKGEEPVDAKLLIDKYINNTETVTEEEGCTECGTFGQYAESRGYTKKALVESDDDEKANLISGYINAFNEGKNHGDAKVISVLAKKSIVESLINDYGHKNYVDTQLKPQLKSLNENTFKARVKLLSEEFEIGTTGTEGGGNTDDQTKGLMKDVVGEIMKLKGATPEKAQEMLRELMGASLNEDDVNEIFGGLGSAMGSLSNLAKKGVDKAGAAIGKGIGNAANAIGKGISNTATAVGDAANAVGDEYKKGFDVRQRANSINQAKNTRIGNEKNLDTSLDTIKNLSSELATAISELNANREKLNLPTIKIASVVRHLQNQLSSKSGNVDLSKFKNESNGLPAGTVEVQPNILQEVEDDDLETDLPDDIELGNKPENTDNTVDLNMEDEPVSDIDTSEMGAPDSVNMGFAPDSTNMGIDTPEHSGVSIVDVNVDGNSKTVNIKLNEALKAIKGLGVALANSKGGNAKPAAVTTSNTKATKQEKTGGVALVNAKGGNTKPAAVTASNTKATKQEKTGGVALTNVKGKAKLVNETEFKMKKYIRLKLEELSGKRKPLLSEAVKSPTLIKLDRMIENEYKQSLKK